MSSTKCHTPSSISDNIEHIKRFQFYLIAVTHLSVLILNNEARSRHRFFIKTANVTQKTAVLWTHPSGTHADRQ